MDAPVRATSPARNLRKWIGNMALRLTSRLPRNCSTLYAYTPRDAANPSRYAVAHCCRVIPAPRCPPGRSVMAKSRDIRRVEPVDAARRLRLPGHATERRDMHAARTPSPQDRESQRTGDKSQRQGKHNPNHFATPQQTVFVFLVSILVDLEGKAK